MLESGNIISAPRPLHALNRLAFGARPGDRDTVKSLGVDRYLAQPSDRESIPEPARSESSETRKLLLRPLSRLTACICPVLYADDARQARSATKEGAFKWHRG
jgi:hypothetical protein